MTDATSRTMVVKVGGSLLDLPDLGERLERLLTEVSPPGVSCVVLVGGGALVDVIRDWHRRGLVDQTEGHRLAMQTLNVTALRLTQRLTRSRLCRSPADVRRAHRSGERAVIVPVDWFDASPGWFAGSARLPDGLLPESWDVTSDTLAACVAVDLAAEGLVLTKSVDSPPLADWGAAASEGLVDSCFPNIAPLVRSIRWVNLRAEHFAGISIAGAK